MSGKMSMPGVGSPTWFRVIDGGRELSMDRQAGARTRRCLSSTWKSLGWSKSQDGHWGVLSRWVTASALPASWKMGYREQAPSGGTGDCMGVPLGSDAATGDMTFTSPVLASPSASAHVSLTVIPSGCISWFLECLMCALLEWNQAISLVLPL